MSNRVKRKNAIIISTIILLLIGIGLGAFIFFNFIKGSNNKKSVIIKEIEGYGYTLENRDTKLMADTFDELEEILTAKNIDYKKYAETLSRLFVIDLFTISNKVDTYDVGSCEYIYPDHLTDYKNNVKSTIYNYIGYIDNRNVDMPEVKTIIKVNTEETTFIYNEEEYEAYIVDISWNYVKDLDYPDKAIITVFRVDNKLYIGEFSTGEAEYE